MNSSFTVVIITTCVAVIGWIINHFLTASRDRNKQQLAVHLKYVERQLEELYGPLAFLLIEKNQSSIDFVEALGREPVFEGENALNAKEVDLWLFWVEKDFLPGNEEMRKLLMTKTHLIEGGKMPTSYLEFLNYHNSWKMRHLLWKEKGVKYIWRSEVSFPTSFSEEVLNTFMTLKNQHNKLREKLL
jgi:hypothetical protein